MGLGPWYCINIRGAKHNTQEEVDSHRVEKPGAPLNLNFDGPIVQTVRLSIWQQLPVTSPFLCWVWQTNGVMALVFTTIGVKRSAMKGPFQVSSTPTLLAIPLIQMYHQTWTGGNWWWTWRLAGSLRKSKNSLYGELEGL